MIKLDLIYESDEGPLYQNSIPIFVLLCYIVRPMEGNEKWNRLACQESSLSPSPGKIGTLLHTDILVVIMVINHVLIIVINHGNKGHRVFVSVGVVLCNS